MSDAITEMDLWFPGGRPDRDEKLPKLQADTMGRWERAKYRKRWHQKTADMLLLAGWRRNMAPWQELSIVYTRCSTAEPDIENLYYANKVITDGLVKAGLIPDDKPKHVPLYVSTWEKATRADSGVRCKLWKLS